MGCRLKRKIGPGRGPAAAVVVVVLTMLAGQAPVSSATGVVGRGYEGRFTHFRWNRADGDGIGQSHIHSAVINGCDYAGSYLDTRSETVGNPSGNLHKLSSKKVSKGPGTLNAGAHWYYSDGGQYFTSPNGQSGWDKCW